MPDTFSLEYTALYQTLPADQGVHRNKRSHKSIEYFTYTQVGTGTDPQKIFVGRVPASSRILLPDLFIGFSIWTASTILDMGWEEYTTPAGVVVAADPNGLIAALDISGTAKGHLSAHARMEATALVAITTPAGFSVEFNSRAPVDITITTSGAVALAAATLEGWYTYIE